MQTKLKTKPGLYTDVIHLAIQAMSIKTYIVIHKQSCDTVHLMQYSMVQVRQHDLFMTIILY